MHRIEAKVLEAELNETRGLRAEGTESESPCNLAGEHQHGHVRHFYARDLRGAQGLTK